MTQPIIEPIFCPVCNGITNAPQMPAERVADWLRCDCQGKEPIKPEPTADSRPGIGKALMLAVETMFARGEIAIVPDESGKKYRLDWPTDGAAKLEHDLCPLLAHALCQPLQFEWLAEYFVAVQLVEIEQKDKGLADACRQTIATYVMMACQQVPWPIEPKGDEEKATTGDASAS